MRAPGRVNLIGEHVDYNDGLVLPAAIDRAVYVAAAYSGDDSVSLEALDLHRNASFQLNALSSFSETAPVSAGSRIQGWAAYPAGVAWALQNAAFEVNGVLAACTSNIPIGSGLSSSAAIEVGFAALWQALGGWSLDRLSLAQLCQEAENKYVGVSSGLMDQFASACGIAGHALMLDTRSLEWKAAPIPEETAIVVADSGVRRSLAHSGYNERRAACEAAVRSLQRFMPQLRSLRDITPTEFAAYAPYLDEIPRKRAEHVVKEIARVQSALSALNRRDLHAFGALMYSGHSSLRLLYEVSTPELDTLVDLTRSLPGCYGARLTGAGFGGCTVNLVEMEHSPAFIQGLKDGYHKATGRDSQVYACLPSQGAEII